MLMSLNGTTLHVEEHGSGDTAVVLLHYWGGTSRTWSAVMDALPGGLRAIALDARGWGRSGRPADGYDVETMADDVQAVVAALGLRRYVLVGHSMGGKVAMLLASRRPPGLVGLVLLAPSPAGGKALTQAEREAMAGAYATAESVARTIDNVLAERKLSAAMRAEAIADGVDGGQEAKAFWPRVAISEDVSAGLPRIDVPVLLVGGERDKVDDVAMLRRVVRPSLPGAVMIVIPGVGHLLPLEAPDEVAGLISEFVERGLIDGARARQPDEIPAAFDDALNRGDLDALTALFCPDAATMRMTDGTVVEGPDALRGALGSLIAMRPRLRNVVRRALRSGDVALLLLDWTIEITPPGGERIVQRGVATQVAERGDGGWRLRIANPLGIA